jgi:hypothetical protein
VGQLTNLAGVAGHLPIQAIAMSVSGQTGRAPRHDFSIDMQIRDPHLHHESTVGIVVDAQHHDVLAFKRRCQHRPRLGAERLVHFGRVDIRHPEIHDHALDLGFEGIAIGDADDTSVENVLVPCRRSFLIAGRCAFLARRLSVTVALAGTFLEVTAVRVYLPGVREYVRAKQESDEEQRRKRVASARLRSR